MHFEMRDRTRGDVLSTVRMPAPRTNRMLASSIAVVGASVIAVNPVAPVLPLPELEARSVTLSAFENPLAVWAENVTTSLSLLTERVTEGSATFVPSLLQVAGTTSLYTELAALVTNPTGALQSFAEGWPTWAATIQNGLAGSNAGSQQQFSQLPAVLQSALEALQAGQFTQAFSHVNYWAIFGIGEAGWPLYPTFALPGEMARAVGAPTLGALFDSLLVGDTTLTGYPHALLVPAVSAIFQFTDLLDSAQAAFAAGDAATGFSDIVNLPTKVLGAFLNGYRPSIAEEWNVFPGFLSSGGPIDSLFVQYPKLIAEALGFTQSAVTTQTTTETAALESISSTALGSDADLITLTDVEVDGEPAPATAEPVDEETAVAEPTETPAAEVEEAATPVVDTTPVVVEASPSATAPPTSEDASESAGTESSADTAPSKKPTSSKPVTTKSESTKSESTKSESTESESTTAGASKAESGTSTGSASESSASGSDSSDSGD